MKPSPLPVELGDVFTVRDAHTAGVTPSRLRSRDLTSPYRGIRVRRDLLNATVIVPDEHPAERAARELREQAAILARSMPENQFFTHVTAAVLWGLPVPPSLLRDSFGELRKLDVGVFAPLRHPRHAGVRGHQVKPGRAHIVAHEGHGVRVTTPSSTWAMLGAVILDEYDLVAIGDACVRDQLFVDDPLPLATVEQLEAAANAGRRVGGPALRRALPRVRTRSASRMETRCRLILLDAGLPEPELNVDVFDSRGEFVACVDMAYPTLKIAIEYEGEHHLTSPAQWARDIARYEALAAAGWFVVRATKRDVFDNRGGLVARVRRVFRRAQA